MNEDKAKRIMSALSKETAIREDSYYYSIHYSSIGHTFQVYPPDHEPMSHDDLKTMLRIVEEHDCEICLVAEDYEESWFEVREVEKA